MVVYGISSRHELFSVTFLSDGHMTKGDMESGDKRISMKKIRKVKTDSNTSNKS